MSSASMQTAQTHPRIQELMAYLELHRRELHEAVASVPAHLREIRPGDGRWSVAEVVEHLALIEQRIAKMLTMHVAAARASGVGPDVETSSVVDSYPKPGDATDRSTKIQAPAPGRPSGALDAVAGTQALAQSRASLTSALLDANGVSLENLMQAHPVFGPLNMYHWMVFTALHDSRHAAQIREIGESLAAS